MELRRGAEWLFAFALSSTEENVFLTYNLLNLFMNVIEREGTNTQNNFIK